MQNQTVGKKGRRQIFAGNWKMHKTSGEAFELVRALAEGLKYNEGREYILFPPAPYLREISSLCGETPIAAGAQNMYFEDHGAFTGEISPAMVEDCGCRFILVGHSERRHIFGESDSDTGKKVAAALEQGLEPLLCVGELLEERENDETGTVLKRQLEAALSGIDRDQMRRVVIAYEPVWAIGTGKVATPEMADEAHLLIRGVIAGLFGQDAGDVVPVLYGGSVKAGNISGLYVKENIDGVLVGGASLEAEGFLAIINA